MKFKWKELSHVDLAKAKESGLSAAMTDRLTLKKATIDAMAKGLQEVAALPDPVGQVTSMWRRPNGLLVGRMRIPLGVIGIIYESRPNVTVDAIRCMSPRVRHLLSRNHYHITTELFHCKLHAYSCTKLALRWCISLHYLWSLLGVLS